MKLGTVLGVLGFGTATRAADAMLKVWNTRILLMMDYSKNGFGRKDMALNL
jgi:hypothetical protein